MSTKLAGAGGVVAQLGDAAVEAARVALVSRRLRGLAGLLLTRGLKVVIRSPVMTVAYPAAVEIQQPRGYSQRLSQSVLLRTTDEGLLWFWIREAPAGHAPQLEPLCPGDDIDQAASRIVRALTEALTAAES
jgi:hypothetical protein